MKEKIIKKSRDLYLIGISFIAGLLFIVQCGGGSSSIADAIAEAIGIDYSNSESGLQASNLQAAIDELAAENKKARAYFPVVYDAANKVVGNIVADDGSYYYSDYRVWNHELQAFLRVSISSGEPNPPDGTLLFKEPDCTGTPYFEQNHGYEIFPEVFNVRNIYYVNNPEEQFTDCQLIKSKKFKERVEGGDSVSVCKPIDNTQYPRRICYFSKAREITSMPQFTGPLHIKGSPKETE